MNFNIGDKVVLSKDVLDEIYSPGCDYIEEFVAHVKSQEHPIYTITGFDGGMYRTDAKRSILFSITLFWLFHEHEIVHVSKYFDTVHLPDHLFTL
jgi:hypothetical protein